MDPAFSSDGKSIAFISNRSGHWNLWTGNADGSGLHELSAQSLLPAHPAWSPDSREIAFDSMASGKGEIWLVNAAGGPPRRLVAMPGGAQVPSWSRDGKRVLFYTNAKGSRNIWEVAATGGAPVPLTNEGILDPSESPDGRYLYYGSILVCRIWRIPLLPRLRGWKPGQPAGGTDSRNAACDRPSFLGAGPRRDLLCGCTEDAGRIEICGPPIARRDRRRHPRRNRRPSSPEVFRSRPMGAMPCIARLTSTGMRFA